MKENPFKYTLDNKRYHTLNYYNRCKFGRKVYKAVLDCGFTCPNIDGTKGYGGCIFCDSGSGYFTKGRLPLKEQLETEIQRIIMSHGRDISVTAYFQSNTNTYASSEELMQLYNTVLENKYVCGIAVGTRGDCLPEEVLDCLSEINKRTSLTVELGMQTVHNGTIELINRCCTHEELLDGFYRLKKRNIRTCIHIINGLPGESAEMMLETAVRTAQMQPDAVKIQMLHIVRGTRLAELYETEPFHILDMEEYVDIAVRQLELLPPETVIERITGDGVKSKLIAPQWSMNKIAVLGSIDKKMAAENTWQGKYTSAMQGDSVPLPKG